MRPLSLSYKFYIPFALILAVPAARIAVKISAFANTLSPDNFFYHLYSLGIFEAPTALAILFFFFWLFNNFLWKLSWIKWLVGIPNINGRYEGKLISSHTVNNEQNGTYPVAIEIKQTLTSISVYLYAERSCSYSTLASICKNYNGNYELVYVYQNKTSAMGTDADMRDHHGSAFLIISEDGKKLNGDYFNNPRERGRYGKISVKKTGSSLKGKF